MALTTTITKKSVAFAHDGMHMITYNMVYADGSTILIDQDFTTEFRTGKPWSTTVTTRMRERMKTAITRYKAEQAIFNGAPIDASVANLNSTVGV